MASLKSVLTLDRLFVIRGPAMVVHLNLSTAGAVGSGERTSASIEIAATGLQAPLQQKPELKKGFDFSSAAATARAYQTKLLEMSQANVQFALEFAQRLAAIRSPVQLLHVIEELTSKRIAMFRSIRVK